MSAQGLLNSVFSCSSTGSKTVSKRKLRKSRSLDPTLIKNYEKEYRGATGEFTLQTSLCLNSSRTGGVPYFRTSAACFADSRLDARAETLSGNLSSTNMFTSLDALSRADVQLDCDVKSTKRNSAWDLPFILRSPLQSATCGSGTIFSPRKRLQKKTPHPDTFYYNIWVSEGDFTWRSECGRCFRLVPVPLQSLSELERVRLQDVAFIRLLQDYDLGCQISIPKDGHKRKKSLRSKLDSLGKEKRDKEHAPQAFGLALQQVIANDRWTKLQQEAQEQADHKDSVHSESFLQLGRRRINHRDRISHREFSSSNSSLSSYCETPNESTAPHTPETGLHARRRGGVSVDCITDLDDGQSRLLEALQLSLPAHSLTKKTKAKDTKLSLNPVYRQVPRIVDLCCQHLEKYGLQTVGIFRVGSSKKRVRQLREEFDQGVEVALGPEHSVHDVAALLKEFLRDMAEPLLPRELYTAFINCSLLNADEQNTALQLLVHLLPACNSDTLQRLLHFLSTVAAHAEDSQNKHGQQLTGNKMNSHNLATILGPNILHKQKSSDKDFSVQTSAQVEDNAVVISTVQRMITNQATLFTVPPELQHEVLVSLVETDYDVVDHLLRRKASHWESPAAPQQEGPLCFSKSGSSSTSNRPSSDEASPLLRRLPPGCGAVQPSPELNVQVGHVHAENRHAHTHTGSHGNLLESALSSFQETFHRHHGIMKKPLRRTQTTPTEEESRPRPHVTRTYSSPLCDQVWRSLAASSWQHQTKSALHQSDESVLAPGIPSLSARHNGRLPPPYPGLPKTPRPSVQPSATSHQSTDQPLQPSGVLHFRDPSFPPTSQRASPAPPCHQRDAAGHAMGEYQDWQTDKWQIWQLLSSDDADTLPETLV